MEDKKLPDKQIERVNLIYGIKVPKYKDKSNLHMKALSNLGLLSVKFNKD